jgi:hypothetical protein
MNPRLTRLSEVFLEEATSHSKDNGRPTIDLITVPSFRSFGVEYSHTRAIDIDTVARDWKDRGFGERKIVDNGLESRPYFTFNASAFKHVEKLRKQKRRRDLLRRMSKPNWTTAAAIVAAIAATLSAYFSYLALPNH